MCAKYVWFTCITTQKIWEKNHTHCRIHVRVFVFSFLLFVVSWHENGWTNMRYGFSFCYSVCLVLCVSAVGCASFETTIFFLAQRRRHLGQFFGLLFEVTPTSSFEKGSLSLFQMQAASTNAKNLHLCFSQFFFFALHTFFFVSNKVQASPRTNINKNMMGLK